MNGPVSGTVSARTNTVFHSVQPVICSFFFCRHRVSLMSCLETVLETKLHPLQKQQVVLNTAISSSASSSTQSKLNLAKNKKAKSQDIKSNGLA